MAERVVIFIFWHGVDGHGQALGAGSLGGTPAAVLALRRVFLLFLFGMLMHADMRGDYVIMATTIRASSPRSNYLDHDKRLLGTRV